MYICVCMCILKDLFYFVSVSMWGGVCMSTAAYGSQGGCCIPWGWSHGHVQTTQQGAGD